MYQHIICQHWTKCKQIKKINIGSLGCKYDLYQIFTTGTTAELIAPIETQKNPQKSFSIDPFGPMSDKIKI